VPLLGVAESPPNTMWPGLRPTSMSSFVLIHRTVWPQYTNVTDKQDNGSIAQGKPFYKWWPKNGVSQQIPPRPSAEALPPWYNQSLSPASWLQSTDPVGQSDFYHLCSPLACRQRYSKLYTNGIKVHRNWETSKLDIYSVTE